MQMNFRYFIVYSMLFGMHPTRSPVHSFGIAYFFVQMSIFGWYTRSWLYATMLFIGYRCVRYRIGRKVTRFERQPRSGTIYSQIAAKVS